MCNKNLSINFLFALCVTVFISSCAIFNGSSGDKEIGFPAKVSLISLAKEFGSLDKNHIPDMDQCVFLDKDKPEESKEIFNNLVSKLISEGVMRQGISEREIEEAFNLVKSGEFKGDIYYTLDSLIKNVDDIRDGLKTKAKGLITDPESSLALINKAPGYLDINPEDTDECKKAIRSFLNITDPENLGACAPGAAGKIIDSLKKDSVTSEVIETARIFTNENNRSSRLAIIVYAKMYGINITEDDLDELDSFLDTSKESDFSPLIKIGIDKLAERYGGGEIVSFIKKKDSECSLD